MKIQDFKQEKKHFISQTENLNIFLNGSGNFYKEYHRYLNSALLIIKDKFPPEAQKWIAVGLACENGSATYDDVKTTQMEIYDYREKFLGLNDVSIDPSSEADALSKLFLFCVEHADDENGVNCSVKTSVIQAIDEFSTIFIETFGNAENLVGQLRSSFGV
jgi:hypothetical protein